jgi:hypothetical protein
VVPGAIADRKRVDSAEQNFDLNDPLGQRGSRVFPVTFAAGDALGEDEVMHFQTPRDYVAGRRHARRYVVADQTVLPSLGRDSGFRADPMRVDAE